MPWACAKASARRTADGTGKETPPTTNGDCALRNLIYAVDDLQNGALRDGVGSDEDGFQGHRVGAERKNVTSIVVPDEILTALGGGQRPKLKIDVDGYGFSATPGRMNGVTKISRTSDGETNLESMKSRDWWYDDCRQVGLDFEDKEQVAGYDERQGNSAELDHALLQRLDLRPEMTMADIGCGTGVLVCEAATMGAAAVGIDVSATMLGVAKARAARLGRENLTFQRAGFLSFEVADGTFDLITTQFALHHLPDFWKALAFDRLHAALKTGGKLYIKDVIFNDSPHRLAEAAEAWVTWMSTNTGYKREDAACHVREEHSTFGLIIERLLTDCGFRILERTHSGVYGMFLAERA